IIETGTYRGTSTEFMSEASKVVVYSVETNAGNFGFAKMRLRNHRNVQLLLGDSREVLPKFFKREGRSYTSQRLLFYLDAHEAYRGDDHPLANGRNGFLTWLCSARAQSRRYWCAVEHPASAKRVTLMKPTGSLRSIAGIAHMGRDSNRHVLANDL